MDVYDVEVEAQAKTVDEAKRLALEKLGLPAERVEFTVVQEGRGGFLGLGGQPAVITARAKPPQRGKKRRGRRSRGKGPRSASSSDRGDRGSGGSQPSKRREARRTATEATTSEGDMSEDQRAGDDSGGVGIEEQASVAEEFLVGLLGAFGLEGRVTTEIAEDILTVRVDGDQTEALVGQRGVIMSSVLELTRTVVQRKTFGAPRMRLDIGGYGERRRQALTIYAGKLADKVLAEGGEVMLEPMNPADRKVVHDAVGEIEGVRSYSEGEDPHRSVVIAAE